MSTSEQPTLSRSSRGWVNRAARAVGGAIVQFVTRVFVDPVRTGRLREVDWPLGLKPVVALGLVGYIVAAVLVLASGLLREWIPLATQAGASTLALPRTTVWLVLALTAFSMSLAAAGALYVRPWLRWLTTALIVVVLLFTAAPDQSDVPYARYVALVAAVAVVGYVAVRGGRRYAWWDFVVLSVLIWGSLVTTSTMLSAVNRALGFDFLPLLLSLMLSTLGQMAVPAALAAGAAVASVSVSSALWATRVVRGSFGVVAVFVVLALITVWRIVDAVPYVSDVIATPAHLEHAAAAVLLLGLVGVSWVVLARVRPGRQGPTASGMVERIDVLALLIAAFTSTNVIAAVLLVTAQVMIGYGLPTLLAGGLIAVATWISSTTLVFTVRALGGVALIVIAIVQARRGRRTTPELFTALGIANILVPLAVLFGLPVMWSQDALAFLGAAIAIAILVVALVRRRLTLPRATSLLAALLLSALFAYREFLTDPLAYLLGFAGGAVVLFGFVWAFLTGYEAANDDSPKYPRPARVLLVLANALFGIVVLAFVALARDPDQGVGLAEYAESGAQMFGDPLVAAALIIALVAAARGRDLAHEEPEGAAAQNRAGSATSE